MKPSSVVLLAGIAAFWTSQVLATTVSISTKVPNTGTPVAQDNPPCEGVGAEDTRNLAERLKGMGSEAVGKATAALGLGGDPFNERRLNNSVCKNLCVTMPIGTQFTAEGSVTPIDWRGPLSSDLPATANPGNWAAITGPLIEQSTNLQVVCYVVKNWSHDQERYMGIKLTY